MINWIKRLVGKQAAVRPPRGRQWRQLTLTQRIDRIVDGDSPRLAIRRLAGYQAQHYWHAHLRFTLGTLHLHYGDRLTAGKLLYFKPKKIPVELRAVDDFRKRYGNDPTQLLRALLGQSPRSPKELHTEVQREVWELIQLVQQREGTLPGFLRGWQQYLEVEFGVTEEV